jgi:hypothetical protein
VVPSCQQRQMIRSQARAKIRMACGVPTAAAGRGGVNAGGPGVGQAAAVGEVHHRGTEFLPARPAEPPGFACRTGGLTGRPRRGRPGRHRWGTAAGSPRSRLAGSQRGPCPSGAGQRNVPVGMGSELAADLGVQGRLTNPITRRWDQPHNRYAGTDDGRGTGQSLTQNDSR